MYLFGEEKKGHKVSIGMQSVFSGAWKKILWWTIERNWVVLPETGKTWRWDKAKIDIFKYLITAMREVKWFRVCVTVESRYGWLEKSYNGNFKAQFDKVPSNN